MFRMRYLQSCMLLVTLLSAGLFWVVQPSTPVYAATTTFIPTKIPLSSPEVSAPFRGLYDYNMHTTAPVVSYDSYIRYSWRELEPSEGVYNFSIIDAHLAEVRALGQRFGFRVRAMSSGNGILVPDYVKGRMAYGWWADADKNGTTDTYVPDWNDADFLSGFERLMNALGQRYGNNPALAYLDIGGYGNWGEFHMSGFNTPTTAAQPATTATLTRIIDAHTNAFNPNNIYGPRLIMMSDNADALRYALQKSPRIGWRRDSLGSSGFTESGSFQQSWQEPLRALFMANRWKTAPVVTEFISPSKQALPGTYQLALQQSSTYHVSLISNGNTKAWDSMDSTSRQLLLDLGKQAGYRFSLNELTLDGTIAPGGSLSVRTKWENSGNAPAYEPWVAYAQLRMAGRVMFEMPLYVDFETMLPTNGTPISVVDKVVLPTTLSAGTYEVRVQIRDKRNYRKPLPLAIAGQESDGSYRLGSVTLTGSSISVPPFTAPKFTCTTKQFAGDGVSRWGQTARADYPAGTVVTLVAQSALSSRGLVANPANIETQLTAIGASFTVLSKGTYTTGFYSDNYNTSSHWVKLSICTPPSPTVAPTATLTPYPVTIAATRTPTPAVGPCAVVRYRGDGSGAYGAITRDSYQAGTTFKLIGRSSTAVRAVYWITNQTPAFLSSVGSTATISKNEYYNLALESQTSNTSSSWIDVRLCPPGVTLAGDENPPPAAVVGPARAYLPMVTSNNEAAFLSTDAEQSAPVEQDLPSPTATAELPSATAELPSATAELPSPSATDAPAVMPSPTATVTP